MASSHGSRFPMGSVFVSVLLVASGAAATPVYTPSCDEGNFRSTFNTAAAGGGIIEMQQGCFLTLTSPLDAVSAGVVIHGNNSTIRRSVSAPPFRLFIVDSGASLELHELTLQNGLAPNGSNGSDASTGSSAGNGRAGESGGAINSSGTLLLEDVTIHDSSAGQGGLGGACNYWGFPLFLSRGGGSGGPGGHGGAIYNGKGATLTVRRSRLAQNHAGEGGRGGGCSESARGGDGGPGGGGGAIWSDETTTVRIESSTIFANTAGKGGQAGGGNDGYGRNQRGGDGGGVSIHSKVQSNQDTYDSTLTVIGSTIEANLAGDGGSDLHANGGSASDGGFGGGIAMASGSLAITSSTILANSGGVASGTSTIGLPGGGGGISTGALGVIENSTIAANRASNFSCGPGGDGGGLYVTASGSINVTSVTFTQNVPGLPSDCSIQGLPPDTYHAGSGAAVYNNGSLLFSNTIVASPIWPHLPIDYPTVGLNCDGTGTITDEGRNISWSVHDASVSGDPGCPSTFLHGANDDPKLGTIVPNGNSGDGPDPALVPVTALLGAGSGALNFGGYACSGTDERGVPRPQGTWCDLGAVEMRIGTIVQSPGDQTVIAPAGATFTARFSSGEIANAPTVHWQISTDGGANFADIPGATSVGGPSAGVYTSTYTRAATEYPSDNDARFEAVFTDGVGSVTTSAAALTVLHYFETITQDLPQSVYANNNSLLRLTGAWDSNPAFDSFVTEVSTDNGSTWTVLQSESPVTCKTCERLVFQDFVTPAMDLWQFRFTLSGGYAGRPVLHSTTATIHVTDDPARPTWLTGFPSASNVAFEGVAIWPARLVAFEGDGNPLPATKWQIFNPVARQFDDLVNGDPSDPDAYHFDTTPRVSDHRVGLQFRAWGDQDLTQYRALAAYSGIAGGFVRSELGTLYVIVPTSITLDCPSKVLLGHSFACGVLVTANPARGPRQRKPCGSVIDGVGATCTLDENAQCPLSILTASLGLAQEGTHTTVGVTYLGNEPSSFSGFCDEELITPFDRPSTARSGDVEAVSCLPPPITVCPGPQTAQADTSTCTASVPDFTASTQLGDYSASPSCGATVTQDPPAGTAVGVGDHTITITATSPAGSTNCTTRLTVTSASGPPTITLNGSSPMTVECHGLFTDPGATATGCGGSIPVTASGTVDVKTPGAYTITYTASDPSGIKATATRTVNVVDTTKPAIQCPGNIVLPAVPGTCAAPATYTARASDLCDGSPLVSYSIAPGSSFPAGSTTVSAFAMDASGNQSPSCSFNVTVTATPTNVAVSLSSASRQYSDAETLGATVTNLVNNAVVPGGTVTFKIGSSTVGTAVVNSSGVATLQLDLVESATLAKADLAPGPHSVTATYNGDLGCYGGSSRTETLTVSKEDARTAYTGAVYSSTSCATCASAVVTLAATVWDISATPDAAGDAEPGDMRNATVTFFWIEGNKALATVPVGLVSAGDTKAGAATYNWNADIGTNDSQTYTIGIRVDGYYTRSSSSDDTVVTVAKPIASNFISGGGFLVMTASGGLKPGDKGSKNNFGFSVKYNKSGTNLQGRINTILRRLESDGVVHVYQIKGNLITSLSVNAKAGTASLSGKASIQDVTDPANPIAIDGNATLQFTMTDKGEPGSSDTIGMTLWNKAGGLWFSSHLVSGKTAEQLLSGGNLVVR